MPIPEKQIRMSSPDLTKAEKDAVMAVLDTPNLSMGEHLQGFEEAVKNYVGAKNAIAVSSGTAGLHLCVRAAGIKEGDLVLLKMKSYASMNIPRFIVAFCRRLISKNESLLAGVEFIRNSRLAGYFSKEELRRLPTEATRFDNAAQDKLVTFTFNQQVELRSKGLL